MYFCKHCTHGDVHHPNSMLGGWAEKLISCAASDANKQDVHTSDLKALQGMFQVYDVVIHMVKMHIKYILV